MELDEGWHTFSLTQKGEGGEPTVIELEELSGLKPIGGGFEPDHSPEIEKPLPELTLEVHNERVTWTRELEVLPGVKPYEYGVRGTITYQTCKTSCLPPHEVSFAVGDVSKARPVTHETPKTTEDVPPSGKTTDAAKPAVNPSAGAPALKKPQDQGLFGFLLTAIGFGFVSLLTPCVFPMVPITVSFFLKQSETEHHKPLAVALVFCGSIIATFTILGVGIAAIFGAAQLNAARQQSLVECVHWFCLRRVRVQYAGDVRNPNSRRIADIYRQ